MTIIVNADDFGKNMEVNRAVLEAFEEGIVTRTTLMMNMPCADEAIALAEQKGFREHIGIHLNLTEGQPLTEEIRANPLFCDEEGYFHGLFHASLKHRLYMDRKAIDQIYKELKAQLERYKRCGLELWHIDSHHHVHTDYPVYRVLKKLSREYSFSSIRLSRNLYTGGNRFMRLYKKIYNGAVRKMCQSTTDFFGSYQDYEIYRGVKKLPEESVVEIMVHPVYDVNGVLMDTDFPMKEEKYR